MHRPSARLLGHRKPGATRNHGVAALDVAHPLDRLAGNDDDDNLNGGAGNDPLTGGGGENRYYGKAGDDYVKARNDVAEIIRCGKGNRPGAGRRR